MRRYVILAVLLLVSLSLAFGDVSVDRQMPSPIEVGHDTNISLKFTSSTNIDAFDVVEFIPHGWTISNWTVYGYNKNSVVLEVMKTYTYKGKIRTAYHWSFRDGLSAGSEAMLVYTLKPKDVGSQEFVTVLTYPGGFNANTTIMSVLPSKGVVFCGNGVCELGETSNNCPQDCPKLQIKVFDITPILTILSILGVAAVVIALIYYLSKHFKRHIRRTNAVEDIRAFLKLGLARGYTLREMINALHGEGIDTKFIQEISKDLKKLESGNKKVPPEAKVIKEIKRVINNLSAEDIDSLYKELGIKKIDEENMK